MTYLDKLREILPWKRKGYEVLGEYELDTPEDGDRQILDIMLEGGSDLSKERHVLHYLYFKTNQTRANAETQLQSKGYETRHGVDYGEALPKSLIAERHGLVNDALLTEERDFLTRIAEAEDGQYDGWEAALD